MAATANCNTMRMDSPPKPNGGNNDRARAIRRPRGHCGVLPSLWGIYPADIFHEVPLRGLAARVHRSAVSEDDAGAERGTGAGIAAAHDGGHVVSAGIEAGD